jgi:hypothetical protein
MLQPVVPATVNQASIEHTVEKPVALQLHYVPAGEPLVTPDHLDQVNKQNTTNVRQALNGVKKRKKAVAATPADNGVSALSAELQNEISIGMNLVIPTLPDICQTTVNAPTVPKRRCLAAVSTQLETTTMAVPTGPLKPKCQGCIHGDLLELKVLEPVHIKHYLKQAGFLALATCAGECTHTISDIHRASPKANLYYCDETNKGFHAPDDDPNKASMECGLILCSPCHVVREARYTLAQATEGTGNRRNSRRATNRL